MILELTYYNLMRLHEILKDREDNESPGSVMFNDIKEFDRMNGITTSKLEGVMDYLRKFISGNNDSNLPDLKWIYDELEVLIYGTKAARLLSSEALEIGEIIGLQTAEASPMCEQEKAEDNLQIE